MAAAAFFSHLAHFVSFLREHPKLSFLLLFLLSPPIFRILLYFTPLLLSTALCIFALITLAPYVTATDAEVERQQSLVGANAYQRKSKSTSTSKGEKVGDGNGNSSLSSSALPSAASSDLAPSGSAAYPSVSAFACPATENSWMSWMKGLNDIGRAWVESKLAEQGLALSEPANRETLLALIEGSFAELVTVEENHGEIFSVKESDVDADDNVMQVNEVDDDMPRKDDAESGTKGPLVQRKRSMPNEVECSSVDNAVDGHSVSREVCVEEPLPISVINSLAVNESAQGDERLVNADRCTPLEKTTDKRAALESTEGSKDADGTSSKQSILHQGIHMPPPTHESTLSALDAGVDVVQASAIMPKTPSRIPAPSRLLEASRRIFSKEEQSKSLLPRAPFQFSGSRQLQPPRPSTGSSAQSKIESTASVMKLPTRKFLDRSKSVSGKEVSKLSSSSFTEKQTKEKSEECIMGQGKVKLEGEAGKCDSKDGVNARASDPGDFSDEIIGEGPKFDEDLEVEEAQALVQSELKMLEVELEEVAAKLPKIDEALAYQKTPVKSVTTRLSPTRTPLKGNIALLSTTPVSK